MPQAVDFTINNAAAAAKVFTLLAPASGVNGEAKWELREGANSTVFPRFTAVLRADPSVKGYSSVMKFRHPSAVTDTTTGLVKPGSIAEVIITVKMPDDFPETTKADTVAFVKNSVAHALWQAFLAGRTAMT
jgi:hypothetical protein